MRPRSRLFVAFARVLRVFFVPSSRRGHRLGELG